MIQMNLKQAGALGEAIEAAVAGVERASGPVVKVSEWHAGGVAVTAAMENGEVLRVVTIDVEGQIDDREIGR